MWGLGHQAGPRMMFSCHLHFMMMKDSDLVGITDISPVDCERYQVRLVIHEVWTGLQSCFVVQNDQISRLLLIYVWVYFHLLLFYHDPYHSTLDQFIFLSPLKYELCRPLAHLTAHLPQCLRIVCQLYADYEKMSTLTRCDTVLLN